MTSPFAYALCAMLFFGCADIVYKRAASAGVLPHHLLMVQSWVFLTSVTLYGLLTATLAFVSGSLWGACAGLFMWIGFHNFAHSLKSGAVSVNAPIFRLSFVITAALAIVLLKEPLTIGKILGIALAGTSVWLLLAAPDRPAPATRLREHPRQSRSSLRRVFIATAAVGIGNLLYKYGLRAGATPASLVVTQALVVVTGSTGFACVTDRGIQPSTVALRYAPLAAVLLAAAFALLVESLSRGDASTMVPLSQMGLAVSAIAGFLFLGERLSLRKATGLAAALAALASFLR